MVTVESLNKLMIEAISAACNVEPELIRPSTLLVDLGMDSFSLTSVVSDVETAHGCQLESDEVLDLLQAESVEELIGRVSKALLTASVIATAAT